MKFKELKAIEQYMIGLCKMYSINHRDFMEEVPDDLPEVDLTGNDLELNPYILDQMAMALGTSVADLTAMNDDATLKWYKKYPYFELKRAFDRTCSWSFCNDEGGSLRLVEAIYGQDLLSEAKPKGNPIEIAARLQHQLRELDVILPGTFHPGAKLEDINVHTDYFFHFKDVGPMVASYIELLQRAEELFFKAWTCELNSEEISEYNVIVSALKLQDIDYNPSAYLHYDTLRKFVPLYKEENCPNFWRYVKIKRHHELEPWRCAEFVENKDLVQAFVDTFPTAKQQMRQFAMSAFNYECMYIWSDARPMQDPETPTPEYLGWMLKICRMQRKEQNMGKEVSCVYLPKTDEELGADKHYIEQLRKLSGPVKLGGVAITPREDGHRAFNVYRMMKRVDAMHAKEESL